MPLFTNETEVDIYADDTTMHTANIEYKNVEKDLQRGASGFQGWCKANKMYINVLKTTCMALGSRQNLSRIEALDICLEKELIQKVEQQKLLGVIIDMSLSWDKQIDSVCLNISRRITLLKILSKYIDKTSMNQYYNSYILPILDYGCLIWGRCTKSNILRLLKLQKKAARLILHADLLTPSELMFNELKWLTFPKRVQYHTCTTVYKALHGLAPEYLIDVFTRISMVHNRNLRSVDNDLLRVPTSKTNFYENSFTISATKLWNVIPLNIRNIEGLNEFKRALKSYLLSK